MSRDDTKLLFTVSGQGHDDYELASLVRVLDSASIDYVRGTKRASEVTKGTELVSTIEISLASLTTAGTLVLSALRLWLNRPRRKSVTVAIERRGKVEKITIDADGQGSAEFVASIEAVFKDLPRA